MRIALITATFPPEGTNGGLASFYYELARCLVAAGEDVLVATLTSGADVDEVVDGIRVARRHFDEADYKSLQNLGLVPTVAYSLPIAVELFRKLEAVVSEFEPEVVECAEHGAQGLFWAAARQFPLVVRCICPQFHLMESGLSTKLNDLDLHLIKAAETYVIEQADAITTPSSNLAHIISASTGLPLERLEIIRNPLTRNEVAPPSKIPFPEGAFPRLLFVGRIARLKGVDLLVEMLPAVVAAYPNAHLTLVGIEHFEPGTLRSCAADLRERLAELGLEDHVNFAGALPRSEISSLQRAADICLFPSRYDSSPYACLEALLAEACVIASHVGGIPEYITHGESGWLVSPEDVQALVEAVILLSGDTQLRNQLSRTAPDPVQKKCAPATVAKETVALYERAVRQFASSPPRSRPRALDFVLSAFEEYRTGTYFYDLYERAAQGAWKEGYRAGKEESQNGSERAGGTLLQSVIAYMERVGRSGGK